MKVITLCFSLQYMFSIHLKFSTWIFVNNDQMIGTTLSFCYQTIHFYVVLVLVELERSAVSALLLSVCSQKVLWISFTQLSICVHNAPT